MRSAREADRGICTGVQEVKVGGAWNALLGTGGPRKHCLFQNVTGAGEPAANRGPARDRGRSSPFRWPNGNDAYFLRRQVANAP